MVIINKDVDYKTRNKKFVTVRQTTKYTDEEYAIQRAMIFNSIREKKEMRRLVLMKARKEKFLMIQYHQRLMLEATDVREFYRLQQITRHMEWELRDIDLELKELS